MYLNNEHYFTFVLGYDNGQKSRSRRALHVHHESRPHLVIILVNLIASVELWSAL